LHAITGNNNGDHKQHNNQAVRTVLTLLHRKWNLLHC